MTNYQTSVIKTLIFESWQKMTKHSYRAFQQKVYFSYLQKWLSTQHTTELLFCLNL